MSMHLSAKILLLSQYISQQSAVKGYGSRQAKVPFNSLLLK